MHFDAAELRPGHLGLPAGAEVQGLALLRQGAVQAGLVVLPRQPLHRGHPRVRRPGEVGRRARRPPATSSAPTCGPRPSSTWASASPSPTGTATPCPTPRPACSGPTTSTRAARTSRTSRRSTSAWARSTSTPPSTPRRSRCSRRCWPSGPPIADAPKIQDRIVQAYERDRNMVAGRQGARAARAPVREGHRLVPAEPEQPRRAGRRPAAVRGRPADRGHQRPRRRPGLPGPGRPDQGPGQAGRVQGDVQDLGRALREVPGRLPQLEAGLRVQPVLRRRPLLLGAVRASDRRLHHRARLGAGQPLPARRRLLRDQGLRRDHRADEGGPAAGGSAHPRREQHQAAGARRWRCPTSTRSTWARSTGTPPTSTTSRSPTCATPPRSLLLRYRDWPQARGAAVADHRHLLRHQAGDRLQGLRRAAEDLLHRLQGPGRGAAGLRAGPPAGHRRPVHRVDLQQEPGGRALPGAHPADPHLGEVQGHHQASGAGHRERGEGHRAPADRVPRGRRRHRHGHRHRAPRPAPPAPPRGPATPGAGGAGKVSTEMDVGPGAGPDRSGQPEPQGPGRAQEPEQRLRHLRDAVPVRRGHPVLRAPGDLATPTASEGKDAVWNAAKNNERFFNFNAAVNGYIKIAEDPKFADHEHRKDALGLAATLLDNDQQYGRAADAVPPLLRRRRRQAARTRPRPSSSPATPTRR